MTPLQVAEQQLIAYNKRDLDAFIALHSPQAKLYNLVTGELLCEGHDAMRDRYGQRFSNENLHSEIIKRVEQGNRIVDHERITGINPSRSVDVVAIYDISDDLIQRVWFIFED